MARNLRPRDTKRHCACCGGKMPRGRGPAQAKGKELCHSCSGRATGLGNRK